MDPADRQMQQATPAAMVVVDADSSLLFVNRRTEELFGYSREELIGQPVEMLLPWPRQATYPQQRNAFAREREPQPENSVLVLNGRRKNGDEFPVEINLSSIRTARGTVVSGIVREVSTYRDAEQELIKTRERLEREALARTKYLAEAGHDLRQPLQSLVLYLDDMQRRVDDPQLHEIADRMRWSIESMSGMLTSLIEIARLDSGSLVPQPRDVELREILDRVVADNGGQAERKGLELDCGGIDCVVRTDPALLQRLLENLVSNAIRFTERGGIAIHCEDTERCVRIAVMDSGIGIPEDELGKIFDDFYQRDRTSRRRAGSCGLGLATVRRIAAILDHRVEVYSVLDQGSIFTVDVPLSVGGTLQASLQV